jgi:thymidylate synthase (FAD)
MNTIQVLDKGHVQLIDMMGDDQRVVDAARVSTGSAPGAPERDRQLIDFLMSHHHETPFEKIVFEFNVKCPIFVARQWLRHRIGSYNERSARYRPFQEEFFTPALDTLPDTLAQADLEAYEEALQHSFKVYNQLLEKAQESKEHRARIREVARGLLGTAYYTEFFWTVNFRSLMNFLSLRMTQHAQYEIRVYANAISELIRDRIPLSWRAFAQFVLKRYTLDD